MTAGRKTMTAIVGDEYGPAPEDVLRIDETDTPAIEADEVSCACTPPAGTEAPGT
jgi:hypothetical protein